jgi:hypothetical protein
MKKLDHEPKVIQMARELGLEWRGTPAANIIASCAARIREWLEDFPAIENIAQVQRIVCAKLKLVIEEVRSEAELDAVAAKYVALGEAAFHRLRAELSAESFAVLMKRDHAEPEARDRYVAVIDCRTEAKRQRRVFTRWHEIAHLLTLHRQLELPFHRTRRDPDPLERLMDSIAGEIGFLDAIFRPLLAAALERHGCLSIAAVEEIQGRFCPEASFQATLIACVKRAALPVAYVEAGWGLKNDEQAWLDSPQGSLFGDDAPVAKLRILSTFSNDAARAAGLRLHRHIEVPPGSFLARKLHGGMIVGDDCGVENLTLWEHSDGSNLGDVRVRIETRVVNGTALAIFTATPAETRSRRRSPLGTVCWVPPCPAVK